MAFFFTAIQHASIATVTLVGSLQPVTVLLGGIRFFGERPTAWRLGWTVVGIVSVGAAVAGAGAGVRATPFGLALSCGALVTLSAYLLVTRRTRARLSPSEYLTGVMVWAALAVTPMALVSGLALDAIDSADVFWLVVVLIGPGALGHLIMNWVITELPLGITALNMLPATVLSIAVAWPVHGEPVTLLQVVAGAVTLVAVGLVVNGRPSWLR
jgi:probable blue pigment (indigoidine) exporter